MFVVSLVSFSCTVKSHCLRFGRRKYLFNLFCNRSVLAMFCSLFGSPEEAAELLLAALALRFSGAGQWGARGAGAPTGGRVASIFLGGDDPFQPETFF
jgi:hypothetical protein